MTRDQHHRQYQLCSRLGLGFALAAVIAHGIERHYRADLDLGFTLLWVAVILLAQGALQHLKSISPSADQPRNPALQPDSGESGGLHPMERFNSASRGR